MDIGVFACQFSGVVKLDKAPAIIVSVNILGADCYGSRGINSDTNQGHNSDDDRPAKYVRSFLHY